MPEFLADKSALARLPNDRVHAVLEPLILAGQVATCGIIDLEIYFSARSFDDLVRSRRIREQAFPKIHMEQTDFDRAVEIMETLSLQGAHQAATIPDLLIAAVAERAQLCILHYDQDFDLITKVTAQSARWVVPRGSV